MSRYRKKPEVVDAIQWQVPFNAKKAPQWFLDGLVAPAGWPLRIWGDEDGSLKLSTARGAIQHAKVGDWLVHADGDVTIYSAADFKKLFSPVGKKGWNEIVDPTDPTDTRKGEGQ
jgi:hypothetical protein